MAQARHVGKVVLSVGPGAGSNAVAAREFELRPDATYVVTGGLGGFGLEVARWMAEKGAQHLALLGRSARPEADTTVEAIRLLGTDVRVLAADVSDEASLAGALDVIRGSMPPIRGVVHAAMVLDDCPLVELDSARIRTAMAPKMMGAWNLHRLTAEDPLELFVLFSSIAAIFGNPLQGNYSAANAFLDALARHRRGLGMVATAVNWGVLSGTGYVSNHPEIGRYLERQGYLSFTPRQALRALEEVLRSGIDSVAVAHIDWQRWSEFAPAAAAGTPRLSSLVPSLGAAEGALVTDGSGLLGDLAAASEDKRLGLIELHIQGLVARVLGTAPDKIEPTRSFTDIGLDSLMAVELMTALKRDTGIEVPVIHLLEGVSVNQLAAEMVTQLGALPANRAGDPRSAVGPAPTEDGNDVPAATPAPQTPTEVPTHDRSDEPAAIPLPVVPNLDSASDTGRDSLASERWPLVVRIAQAVLRLFFKVVARVEVEGLEHVPTSGAVVIVGNHLSFFDAPLLLTVLSRRTTLFAGEFLRKVPVVAGVLRASGAIFVDRGEGDVSALEAGLAVLASGGALGIAPEGIRSSSGGLRQGFTGAAYLSGATSAPLLPVVAFGQELISHNSRRVHRSRVRIRFGPPLPPAPGTSGLELRRHTQRVMETLAAMLPEDYRGEFAEQNQARTGT
jgi:1-acyl-sn-glycerol-3-phosphate acyltransferase